MQMMESFELIAYRISGWSVNIFTIFIAVLAVKSKLLTRDNKYLIIGIYFCFIAFMELIGSITAVLLSNNLFLDYIYIPVSFALLSLYLSRQHTSKRILHITVAVIFLFCFVQLFKAFDEKGYQKFNSIGAYIDTMIMLGYSLTNLSLLFLHRSASQKLRKNADFWFTITIFSSSFLDLIISILSDTSYAAGSDSVLYALFIFRNFFKTFLLIGFQKGIKLL